METKSDDQVSPGIRLIDQVPPGIRSIDQVSPGIRLIDQVPLGIRSSDRDNTIREDISDYKHLRNGLVLKDRIIF